MTYHLESDGKAERINHIIEYMLRMYVMDQPSRWEDYIYLIEFDYNNGYQEPLNTTSFEALYGRKCKTPISWDNPTNRAIIRPELLKKMGKRMLKIRNNLKDTR
jgi:hypothetical protein